VLLEIREYAPHLLRPQFRAPTGPSTASISNPERLTPADDSSEKASRPFEIYVDGGINRGTDVVKALCLGANAVGVGRGFLYAQSVAGTEGVKHAVGSELSLMIDKVCSRLIISLGIRNLVDIAAVGCQQAR
jgi:L-lactate dehydrogenase (cytochrome)